MNLPIPLAQEALDEFAAHDPAAISNTNTEIDFVAVRAGMQAEGKSYDAVCINSMSDSGLHALRSRLEIPMVGPGRTCMRLRDELGI